MITKDNFKEMLRSAGFQEKESGVFVKDYRNGLRTFQMKADFNTEQLEYAQGVTIVRGTTCNFSDNENFVVFVCVCQLLDRGYAPQNIELEASAGVAGRGQTNTYLDILVKDNDGNNYLIIECKTTESTYDDEFAKAWRKVERDGGQLFNYFTLFRTPHLCLYACDFIGGKLKPRYNLIILKDENLQFLDDTYKEGYRDLNTTTAGQNDYFRVWSDTYEQAYLAGSGIFEPTAKPYEISTKITRTFDELEEVDDYQAIQRKYNEFATIMRQHNVGSREKAFDKLVNLFLAKIVDEENNKQDLKFNWKGVAFDDYYAFQDRLQALYTQGMGAFLKERVTYVNEETIRNAFCLFKNDPDATRDKIIQYFREQKFYSNNDFAFLDVHNKELFLKNIAVLIRIVMMLQDIRMKSDRENQFLGDLFEGFLDQGVKQSEGQFFTPIPIVKFLVSSLPVEEVVRQCDDAPWVIDYACGAGHFLNEIARRLRTYAERYKPEVPLKNFYSHIVGIEKEYRLSKVAKVSAFMYSQDNIKIVYGDALAHNEDIADGSFNILVANPPYSVKGFLETLTKEERTRYQLYSDELNLERNNSIETFFIERAAQLLTAGGVCAIILPSSVLSNGGIYIACREIILKYFDLVAIAEFGSGTFGKTGTNTVTLFMRRKASVVDAAEHLLNRATAWLKGDYTKDVVFADGGKLDAYCRHCGIDAAQYRQWTKGSAVPTATIFADYTKAAESQTRYKAIAKKKITAKYTAEQQAAELAAFVADYIRQAERDKLHCFLLAASVGQPVLIVKSPTDSKAIKQFLGYEWSGAKGSEGIKYLGQAVADDEDQLSKNKGLQGIRTPLFNPQNLDDPTKINMLIRRNFLGEPPAADAPDCVKYARLTDMIDFSRVAFDKAIRTSRLSSSIESPLFENSKYNLISVAECGEMIGGLWKGKNPPFVQATVIRNTNFSMDGNLKSDSEYPQLEVEASQFEKRRLEYGDIIIEKSGGSATQAVGRVVIFNLKTNEPYSFSNFTNRLRVTREDLNPFYLHLVLNEVYQSGLTFGMQGGMSGLRNLNIDEYKRIKIPLPPLAVQQRIAEECEAIDSETAENRAAIVNARSEIERIMASVEGETMTLRAVAPFVCVRKAYADISPQAYVSTDNLLQDCAGKKDYDGTPNISSVTAYAEGDILLSNIRPYLKKLWLADCDGGCNPDVLVLRPQPCVLPRFVYCALRRQQFFDYVMTDVKGMKMPRGKKEVIERYTLPIPSLAVQRQTVAEIADLEAKIAAANVTISTAPQRKQAILDKHLK